MKKVVLNILSIILLSLSGCEKNVPLAVPEDYDKLVYYTNEIIPDQFKAIYGKWKLQEVSGGFSGGGYEPDFDFLEIKRYGIYGLIRNDSIFEYGRITLDTFDIQNPEILQIKLIPEYFTGRNPYFYPQTKYVYMEALKKLTLNSPCCDMFNHHFTRVY